MAYQLQEINRRIQTDVHEFLAECDDNYAQRVSLAADKILTNLEHSPIVLLSGPSGSGKTTTAMKIAEELQRLDFYLEDGEGNRYEKGSASGLAALGDSYLFESPYFSDPDSLTLYITRAEWLEKGREFLPVDLNTGEALAAPPEGIGVSARREEGGTVSIAFYGPQSPGADETHHLFYQVCPMYYRAPDGWAL